MSAFHITLCLIQILIIVFLLWYWGRRNKALVPSPTILSVTTCEKQIVSWWPVLHRLLVWVGIAMMTEFRTFMKATSVKVLVAMSTPELIWTMIDVLSGMLLAALITIRVYTDTSLARHLDGMAQDKKDLSTIPPVPTVPP